MDQYEVTLDFLSKFSFLNPKVGLILGSGLGKVVEDIQISHSIPYRDIPGFIETSIPGHQGNLIFGELEGTTVVALQGRTHFYEGHSMGDITYPIRILKLLGVELLITSNATGGMNPDYEIGDLMIVKDHINLMGENPLRGKNDINLGPRFLDCSKLYDRDLIHKVKKCDVDIKIHEGVLVALSGPSYETPAEYNFLRIIGGDAVGMSTIPEVLVARHMGMKVFSMSLITDLGVQGKIVEITHDEVQEVANRSSSKIIEIVKYLLKNY